MSQTQKSIAVLTSGGDAPGMNAAVRAVVRAGINKGMKVYGVYRGYNGLLNGDVEEMNLRSVSDIIGNGGTMLYTARSEEYATPQGIQKAADFLQKHRCQRRSCNRRRRFVQRCPLSYKRRH